MNNLSILEQIQHCTKKMVRLEWLMIKDKNFRFIYERNFARYFRLRKNLILKLHRKHSELFEFENKLTEI